MHQSDISLYDCGLAGCGGGEKERYGTITKQTTCMMGSTSGKKEHGGRDCFCSKYCLWWGEKTREMYVP